MKRVILDLVLTALGFLLICNAMDISEIVSGSRNLSETAHLLITLFVLVIGCAMIVLPLNGFKKNGSSQFGKKKNKDIN